MSGNPVLYVIMQSGAAANGGITSITNVMLALRDHRPIVVTNVESPRTVQWRKAGIEVHVVREAASSGIRRRPLAYAATYLRYHRAVRRLLKETGARIVHANDPLSFQLSLTAVKVTRGASIAFNLRDTVDPARAPPSMRYRLLFAAADHVFYLSHDMADRWTRIAANAKCSCSVTYSIVDFDDFRPMPLPQGGTPIVLLCGILCPKKGQLDFILNAGPQLALRGVHIWIAGDFDPIADQYAAACSDAARPLGEAVRFLGYRADLPSLIERSSVVAVASKHEGLVRSMIEGMSCGRPVVSFSVCSAHEMLSQGAGTVIQPGDYGSMAEAIARYCFDGEASKRAATAGTEAARLMFDRQAVVRRYEDGYRSMAGESVNI